MSLSAFPLKTKFLFDENVDKRLEKFLKHEGVDITSKPKGLSNGKLASLSKSEKRVFVTNDSEFIKSSKEEIFSVVWLRVPQRKIESSKKAFLKLLKEAKPEDFEGKLFTLYENKIEFSELA